MSDHRQRITATAAPTAATFLRDAGVSAGEYVEQITCLLFLKMDDERSRTGRAVGHPAAHRGRVSRPHG